jgi:hypothetical protein
MKKQIFILVILVVAVFASVNESFGQSVHHSVPLPLVCPNDALHPIAGKEYTYDILGSLGAGTYTYWATKNPDFYAAADSSYAANLASRLKVAAGELTNATDYGAPTTTATSTKITWTTDLLAKTKYQTTPNFTNPTTAAPSPTFVAVHYKPTAGCADNFKVFELDPKNGFTVDILSLDPVLKTPGTGDYTFAATQCFANVTSAKYNAGKMDYLYGNNTLYYEVVASNFSASWTPSFKISGLQSTQTATIEWDYTNTFASPVLVAKFVGNGTYTQVPVAPATVPTPAATTITDTSNGVSIFVRVTVRNNSFEGLADLPITFAVDGINSSSQLDVVNASCVTPVAADFLDAVTQTLNKRPTVTEGTSTTSVVPTIFGIVPKNP